MPTAEDSGSLPLKLEKKHSKKSFLVDCEPRCAHCCARPNGRDDDGPVVQSHIFGIWKVLSFALG